MYKYKFVGVICNKIIIICLNNKILKWFCENYVGFKCFKELRKNYTCLSTLNVYISDNI